MEMTKSQVALYGEAWWLGPLFLTAHLLVVWYLENAPFTERGRRRVEGRATAWGVETIRVRGSGPAGR